MTGVRVHRVRSRILRGARTVRALVPPEPRALLVLADGANVFSEPRASRRTWGADRAARALDGLAIVAVDAGRTRTRDYLPYPDPRARRRRLAYRADRYAAFLAEELLPFLERRHPALAGITLRGVGGSSYGAVAALRAATRTPDFSRVLVESIPPWIGGGRLLDDVRTAPVIPRRAWVGAGTAESRDDDVAARVADGARALAGILRSRGARVRLRIVDGARHDERAWAGRLPLALRYLFSELAE
ncbi:MAG TPA: alpha/beta hydrolase-fold protein [Candidatus Limnocylindria bacterium]|nr:alpha/beta hydrolase-fold protein [Candidatus Limnocylindria bacterium]